MDEQELLKERFKAAISSAVKAISEKFDLAINKNLIPILCVGETLQEKENGIAKEAIEHQINSVLENFSLDLRLKYFYGFAVAYEPVWAIGTGLSATPELLAGDSEGLGT